MLQGLARLAFAAWLTMWLLRLLGLFVLPWWLVFSPIWVPSALALSFLLVGVGVAIWERAEIALAHRRSERPKRPAP